MPYRKPLETWFAGALAMFTQLAISLCPAVEITMARSTSQCQHTEYRIDW
ncbi:hypothetical protein [Aidingimonas lacisalsi]|nr:hypothetical protein [Aidingimonas lacisalsi]